MIPSVTNYGRYSSDNYGVHTLKVGLAGITLWYSYRTVIAFSTFEDGMVIRENDWSTVTGRHLNWIDKDHSKRIPSEEFEQKLESALKREQR